jgi:hypothetical protein
MALLITCISFMVYQARLSLIAVYNLLATSSDD